VQSPEPRELRRAHPHALPWKKSRMPSSPPKSEHLPDDFVDPGMARSACSAARSAGCSQETPEISGRATRGRAAGDWSLAHLAVVERRETSNETTCLINSLRNRPATVSACIVRRPGLIHVAHQVVDVLDPDREADQRIGQPISSRIAFGTEAWVIDAGWPIRLSTRRGLGQRKDLRRFHHPLGAAVSPSSIEIIPPKPLICLRASSCCG